MPRVREGGLDRYAPPQPAKADGRQRLRRSRAARRVAIGALLLAIAAVPRAAGAEEAAAGESSSVEAPAIEGAPVLDGVLGPDEWSRAARFELRYQIDPGDKTAPAERTEVFLMRSAGTLFVAFHAYDHEPGAVRSRVARRDDVFGDDYVALYLDTFNDRQHAYALFFNPLGIQADGIYTESEAGFASRRFEDSVDLTWDGTFESKGAVGADGWIVEAAIPWKALRFASGEGQVWGLHVQRWIARRAERDSWTAVRRDVSGLLVQIGSLGGLDEIYTGRTLDLIPTITLSREGVRVTGGTLHETNRLDAGITANWALAPHLVLGGTVNPDFSQVESDVPQIVVDQRFPLFFPEKRPFFLEGSEVFLPSQPGGAAINMLDTRAIVDPDWGVKLTGKLDRTAIGILASSDRAPGLRVDRGDPGFGRNAEFTILRVRQDVSKDSAVGFFVNDWRHAGSENRVYEGDGLFRLSKADSFAFQAGETRLRDDAGRRTDAGFSLSRLTHSGKRWKFIVSDKRIGNGYSNEAGFVRRSGIRSEFARLAYDARPATKTWYVAFQPFVIGTWQRTTAGFLDESYLGQGVDAIFPDGVSASFFTLVERDYFGGTSLRYRFYNFGCEVEKFKLVSFSTYVQFGGAVNFDPSAPVVGDSLQIASEVTVKPNDRLTAELLYEKARLMDRASGAPLYDQDIIRNRTVYQFTRNTAARAIVEYDTFLRRLSSSLLYSFTPHPNTAVYVGYGEIGFDGLDPLSGARAPGYFALRRTVFMKLSYDFRPESHRPGRSGAPGRPGSY